MKKPTKYYSTIILRYSTYDRFLFRFADRSEAISPSVEVLDRIRSCMIYFLCKRPIISIKPGSLMLTGEVYRLTLGYKINGILFEQEVALLNGMLPAISGRHEIAPYPHKSILSYDEDGNQLCETLISNFVHLLLELPPKIRDLEVLYIGKGTSDCAIDRLDGHSTLEKILADILRDDLDSEVAILLHSFTYKKDALAAPHLGEKAEIRGEPAKVHFAQVLAYKPTIEAQTLMIEAMLIDYFKTDRYNNHYTNGLSKNHSALKDFYSVDFDALVVEMNNENIGYLKVYSAAVQPSYAHNIILDVRKNEGRESLLSVD